MRIDEVSWVALPALLVVGACVSFPEVTGGGASGGGGGTAPTSSGGAGGGGGAGAGGVVECERTGDGCLSLGADQDQATIAYDGQALVIVPQTANSWWTTTQGAFVRTTWTGAFAVATRVTVSDGAADPGSEAFEVGGLLVRDANRWMKFEVGFTQPLALPRAGRYLLGYTQNGASQHLGNPSSSLYVEATDVSDGNVRAWLGACRLEESDPVSFFYRNDDQSVWTLHPSTPIPGSNGNGTPSVERIFEGTVELGMIAGDFGDPSPDASARFETFAIVVPEDSGFFSDTCVTALNRAAEQTSPHCGFCAFPPPR